MQGGGVEPPRLAAIGPQPIVSADSTIPASHQCKVQSGKFEVFLRTANFALRTLDFSGTVPAEVIAPSDAEETSEAYFAMTPAV